MKNPFEILDIKDSPLLSKISKAIDNYEEKVRGIWINISREGENYEPENEKAIHWVKWLSWTLVDEKDEDLFEPHLAMVHGDLSEKQLNQDLKKFFGKFRIIVDNEIYFDD
jgi:hypothetical protein